MSTVPGEGHVASMTADGAYDGEAVYDAVAERHPGAAVIIPPRATAVASGATTTQRDQHIATIAEHGRMGWPGNVQVTAEGVWSKRPCFATRPSSVGAFTPGICPISGPRRKSDAACSTG